MSCIDSYPDVKTSEDLLHRIRTLFSRKNFTFSKTQAAKLVGGEYRLEQLVLKGKIRMDKPACKQNGKWLCNGADVMENIRFY